MYAVFGLLGSTTARDTYLRLAGVLDRFGLSGNAGVISVSVLDPVAVPNTAPLKPTTRILSFVGEIPRTLIGDEIECVGRAWAKSQRRIKIDVIRDVQTVRRYLCRTVARWTRIVRQETGSAKLPRIFRRQASAQIRARKTDR